jgi:putative membrane-bound dehydrogenase-like protein
MLRGILWSLVLLGVLCDSHVRAEDLDQEMPRLAPVEPKDAAATLTVQQGFRMTLVAHEPDVCSPVDACFDEFGRMYVAEFRSYPFSKEARPPQQPDPIGRENACTVRRLEDTDGDGIFDTSIVFADQLSWVISVCCYDGGVFVLAPANLYYLKDSDGDGKADLRKTVLTGFSRANVQAVANNMKWGLDNRITVAGGMNGGELFWHGRSLGDIRGTDFRFDPREILKEPKDDTPSQDPFRPAWFERITGGQQFGNSFDDWGNRFVCSNSNHIQHVLFPRDAAERTPGFTPREMIRSIAKEGPAAPVFRKSPAEPWRVVRTRRRAADPEYQKRLPATELVATGFFTSATGVTIYRGDAYPQEFRGQAFIGDVGGNLVHRKKLTPNGASFIAERADEDCEFIASTDTWFRPVNFVNGPDGCLYILDMYRETIEHPYSIPDDIKQHVDLESGHDRGRIWRLEPPDWLPPEVVKLGAVESAKLPEYLDHSNAWHRETAQRLMWESPNLYLLPGLRKVLLAEGSEVGRIHALRTLDGIGYLDSRELHAVFNAALMTGHYELAAQAIGIRSYLIDQAPSLSDALRQRRPETIGRLQFRTALSLADRTSSYDIWFKELALNACDAPEIQDALLSSLGTHSAVGPFRQIHLVKPGDEEMRAARTSILDRLAALSVIQDDWSFRNILHGVADDPEELRHYLLVAVSGLRQRNITFFDFRQKDASSKLQSGLDIVLQRAVRELTWPDTTENRRIEDLELLSIADWPRLNEGASDAIAPRRPEPVRVAAARAVSGHRDPAAADWLVEQWSSASPAVRMELLNGLLRTVDRSSALLNAIEAGAIKSVEISADARERLRHYPSEEIKKRVAQLLETVSADRAKVIADYEPALESGDSTRGAAIFRRTCVACHKVGSEGYTVGPELVSVKNKSPRDLLLAILDPNREALPQYIGYTAATDDGRVFSGILAADTGTSITLRRSEGKEDVIPRDQLETLKSTGQSLMPVGMEKDLTPQDMADVIAWIRGL